MVLALQTYYALVKFGAETSLGPVLALSLIRNWDSVLSALMVTGRWLSLTAEIGIMRISEQIDALDAMALSPYKHLVIPTYAGIISILLAAIFVVVGVWGGLRVAVGLTGVLSGTYFGGHQRFR